MWTLGHVLHGAYATTLNSKQYAPILRHNVRNLKSSQSPGIHILKSHPWTGSPMAHTFCPGLAALHGCSCGELRMATTTLKNHERLLTTGKPCSPLQSKYYPGPNDACFALSTRFPGFMFRPLKGGLGERE